MPIVKPIPLHDEVDVDRQSARWLRSLVESLLDESKKLLSAQRVPILHCQEVEDLFAGISARGERLSFGEWTAGLRHYDILARKTGSYLNNSSSVASCYDSMNDFWADLDAQESGRSDATVWDTYENGRRRKLELLCAKHYGAESALLVNSGMAALLCAVWAGGLRQGSRILVGSNSYFETSQLLDELCEPMGLVIERVHVETEENLRAALERFEPTIALLETATNLPWSTTPSGYMSWRHLAPETMFVVDNSVQGSLTKWFELGTILPERFLVVESAVKYLTHHCMAGIVYGATALVDRCRSFARVSGLLLQQSAFNYLRAGEVTAARDRLSLHSRNAMRLVRTFRRARATKFEIANVGGDLPRGDLLANGVGATVFVWSKTADEPSIYRTILDEWRSRLEDQGLTVPIRAGFGWSSTTARVYESTVLNVAEGASYLRISVGLEPPHVIDVYAQQLARTCSGV